MQQAQPKQQAQKPQPVPVKVQQPKQSQGCEVDRLMAMFDKL